jgi:nucleoside diphosphate kinase
MIDTVALSKIKSEMHLLEGSKPSIAVCVMKPNQPMQTVLRALRSIANNLNPEGLAPSDANFVKIRDIQMLQGYDEKKVQHLIIHDILYDDEISNRNKNKMRYQFQELFENKDSIIQICIEGVNALTKLKTIIGQKDPKDKEMQTLRNFYGVDRVDNAFYVSETI